jgi:formamidopyrimidine-DNA glycosylase
MPELPEVEIYRRYVEKHALRQRIEGVRVPDRRILRGVTAPALDRALRGRRLVSTRRHGKHLFVEVERSEWLYLHFGMTGDLHYYSDGETPRFSKVILDFARNRHLAFEDARLFGGVSLVYDPDELIVSKRLGADPLDETFKPAVFRDARYAVGGERSRPSSCRSSSSQAWAISTLTRRSTRRPSIHSDRLQNSPTQRSRPFIARSNAS